MIMVMNCRRKKNYKLTRGTIIMLIFNKINFNAMQKREKKATFVGFQESTKRKLSCVLCLVQVQG